MIYSPRRFSLHLTGYVMLFATLIVGTAVARAWQPADEASGDASESAKRVLIVTGEDYPGHKWRETTPVLKQQLAKDKRLAVEVTEDLNFLRSPRLHDYDAVVMHFKNYDPDVPGKLALDNLVRFVEKGGGLMLVHFACGAFEEFKQDYERLAGRVWFGLQPPPGCHQHDPHGRFTVHIADAKHPVTESLSDFETVDELYTCLVGTPPITVLASAVPRHDQLTQSIAVLYATRLV